MKTRTVISTSLLLLGSCVAVAVPPPVPAPAVVAESDLIVIGEVIEAAAPQKQTRQAPNWRAPVEGWWRTATITVTKVLSDRGNAQKDDSNEAKEPIRQLKVVCQAPQPRKGGPPGIRPMIIGGAIYPNLGVGKRYLLMLRNFPGAAKGEFFLPGYPRSSYEVNENNKKIVARIEKLADLDNWPWGKIVGGVQMALLPAHPQVNVSPMHSPPAANPALRAYTKLVFALRNTTDKPISVNLYPPDKCLSLSWSSEGRKRRRYDLYAWLARSRRPQPRFDANRHVRLIAPGRIVLVGTRASAGGAGYTGVGVSLDGVKPGKMKLTAAYESKRDLPADAGVKLWKGKIESAEATVEVKNRRDEKGRGPVKRILRKGNVKDITGH